MELILLNGKETVNAEGWLSAASTKREFNFKSRIYVHRKWNVLSKMVIPRLNLSCQYISSELEEIEREDNFRLKRFKELKIKKQKAKEVVTDKCIPEECPVCAQESEKTICTCKSNAEIPETDKVSIRSVYRNKETEIQHDRKPNEIKKERNVIDQEISQPVSKTTSSDNKIKPSELIELNQKDSKKSNKSSQAESVCETKASGKEVSSRCAGTMTGIDTITRDDFSPTSQNQDANTKIVTSTCSCSQLADNELLSDESKQKGNKGNQNVESLKEVKVRKYTDKDGNIRVEKRTITTTYEKKNPVSKCCSDSEIYKKPSKKGDQMNVNSCGSAPAEVSKAPRSVAVCSDANKNNQEVLKKSAHSTQSASLASVDYSCIDKNISAASEEEKTTQTCPPFLNDTKPEKEKPKSSYCTIKIYAKADSVVPSDESKNIELTPSTLDLLRKIILQASKSPASSDFLKQRISSKCDCGFKASGLLKQKSTCPANKQSVPSEIIEDKKTQGCCCQKKPEQDIQDKEEEKETETGAVEVGGREMKNVSIETITGSIKKPRPVVKKHSCESRDSVPKHSIIKKQISVCSCKSKKSINNTEVKCPCSKSQNAPPEQKTCSCSKIKSEEGVCKCNSKPETLKPRSFSASKLPCTCGEPKPKSDLKCCNKSETDKKSIGSISNKLCSKSASANKASEPDSKDISTQKQSFDSCCSQKKPPKTDSKTTASKCSLCGKKDASTSTRRSDRYDVRPLRLLMQSKSAPSACLSDSVLDKNKKSNDTKLRKCISYNDSKKPNRKSNVLGKIVIPRLNVTTQYINSELEEKEREEVFRLKRVKQKKDADKRIEETARRERYLEQKAMDRGGLPAVPEVKEAVKETKTPDK